MPAKSNQPQPFDAPGHMRKIRTRQGMQDYLDVKWRVAWLRAEHPTAQVVTEQIEGTEDHARFKCTITLPTGGIGTGHGSETLQDFPDFYEKAETKSIGRACAVLGYGTDAASDFDEGEPLDGAAASKGERQERHQEARQQADRAAQAHGIEQRPAPPPPQPAPASRLPATRNPPPAAPAAATPPVEGGDALDRSNVHQHAQLRALMERGFDLAGWIRANVSPNASTALEGLTREQAKNAIIDGRMRLTGSDNITGSVPPRPPKDRSQASQPVQPSDQAPPAADPPQAAPQATTAPPAAPVAEAPARPKGPGPAPAQLVHIQEAAIQRGYLIGDDWDWRQIGDLVAQIEQQRPDATWAEKLDGPLIYGRLMVLPTA